MKFTLPSLWFITLFLGYWASIVLAYPLGNRPSSSSLSIRVEGIEAYPVHFSRSWTRSDDLEDLEARKFIQKIIDFHHKYLSRGSKHGSHTPQPLQVHVHVHSETKIDSPTHAEKVFWKPLPRLPIDKPLPQLPIYAQPHRHSGIGAH